MSCICINEEIANKWQESCEQSRQWVSDSRKSQWESHVVEQLAGKTGEAWAISYSYVYASQVDSQTAGARNKDYKPRQQDSSTAKRTRNILKKDHKWCMNRQQEPWTKTTGHGRQSQTESRRAMMNSLKQRLCQTAARKDMNSLNKDYTYMSGRRTMQTAR